LPTYSCALLNIFPNGWQVPNLDVHKAVREAFSQIWCEELFKSAQEYVGNHVEFNESVKDTKMKYCLTDDEAAAIVYYTLDLSGHVEKEHNVYKLLNSQLCNRKLTESLLPYINYLLRGLQKLPNFNGTVYRGLDIPLAKLSSQYKPNNMVVWVAFTSTTKDLNIMKEFAAQNEKGGTWMSLEVTEGKEISCFSIFPAESEILLMPNSRFHVVDILSENMKLLAGIQPKFDCLTMKQQPTLQLERLILPEPEQPKSETMWYLIINRVVNAPHEVKCKSPNYAEVLSTYKKQPLNYSSALIFIEGKSFPKIKKFYGNPLFREGMLKLAHEKQNQ